MSKYTTEVRYICEVNADLDESKGFNNVDEIITEAAPKIFDFEFPIYDEAYRLPFEKMILRHFYMREIGLETVGLWKLKLWIKTYISKEAPSPACFKQEYHQTCKERINKSHPLQTAKRRKRGGALPCI